MIDRFYRDSGTRFHSHNAFDTTNKGPLLGYFPVVSRSRKVSEKFDGIQG